MRAWVGSAVLAGLAVPLAVASPATAQGKPAHDDPARAYVANVDTDTVSVIDTRTNTVTTTITGVNAPAGLAITPRSAAAPRKPKSATSS
ncbi:hypothetical protein [Streptomyces sp. TS71-3]|uniref:hypothetical protein n=1 Tax=Streptomyces sp. TS71-3 TaxID=2733862 RepID=UPI001B22D763|nr:hypothetical protein [Streptomyces sp. TS71-3]GHJ40204.1 hypothetical protein Sm713_58130 [Streptomyces sp. TS71-3]